MRRKAMQLILSPDNDQRDTETLPLQPLRGILERRIKVRRQMVCVQDGCARLERRRDAVLE